MKSFFCYVLEKCILVLVSAGLGSRRSRVQTPTGPTLRNLKQLRGKCCLCKEFLGRKIVGPVSQRFHLSSSRGTSKNPHHCSKGVLDVDPGGVANLSWAGLVIYLGKLHDPPSGVVMATCKQCLYVIKVLTSFLLIEMPL